MPESRLVVAAALAGNAAIAATKYGVAMFSGSAAMLAEALHSTVDTGNSLLLLIGIWRSRRPADLEHPFGHGKELYFWSLIVALLIFGVGGGIAAYEGGRRLLAPPPLAPPFWNYLVLGCAALFEGATFTVALRAARSTQQPGQSLWQAMRESKDPGTYTVLAEDGAALAGLAIAAAGIYASHALLMPRLDGLASMLIGLLMAGTAVLLMREARGLLVGEGMARADLQRVRALVAQDPAVVLVARPLTMYLGPDHVLMTLAVQFRPGLDSTELARAVARIEAALRIAFPVLRRIFIEGAVLAPLAPLR